jgi:hypothetical protein
MIQDIINKLINWFCQNDIAEMDKEYLNIIKGKQFPDEKQISEQLDFALDSLIKKFLSIYTQNEWKY